MKYLAMLLLFTSISITAQNQPMQPTVNVTGEGKVKVVPDGVDIRVRVETQGKDAKAVKAENDQSIDKVIKFLRSQGIENKNVNTEYINLNKNYDYNTKTYSYNANQTLKIQLKDLDKYEAVMAGLLNAGINRIDGVSFNSSNMENYRVQARIKAVEDAKEKAVTYAGVLNQTIGKAIQISEQGIMPAPQPMYRMQMESVESDSGSGETIAPGEIVITAKVSVSFLLN